MRKFVIPVALALFFLSCSCNSYNKNDKINETPRPLRDSEIRELSSISKRYNNDLLEELYQGLINENKDIEEIETLIDEGNTNKKDILEGYRFYQDRNDKYYLSVNTKVQDISDTALKSKLFSIIKSSSKNYELKSHNIESIIKQIESKSLSVKDYHATMKIILTIPLIENYQKVNLPNDSIHKALIKRQDIIINKINSLIKK